VPAATVFTSVQNRVSGTIAGGVSAGATTIPLTAGQGLGFPAGNFYLTIEDEIVLVTSRTGDSLTVTRAQQGTTGAAHADGTAVRMNITAGHFQETQAAINALETGFDEYAQDTIAGSLTATSTIGFSYNDGTGKITAFINGTSITNALISNTAAIAYSKLNLASSIVNADIAGGAAIALSKLAVDPLARANHTGTQVAATISDFSTAVLALLTDANLPDNLTLTNLTQITNRSHSDLQNLSADDHSQYALLAGRTGAGGQLLYGGTAAADGLTLKPSSAGSPTGAVTVDLSGGTAQQLAFVMPAASSAVQNILGLSPPATMHASASFRAFPIGGSVTWDGNVNAIPYLVFNFNVATTYDNLGTGTNVSGKTATVYRDTPTYGSTGAGAGTIKTLVHHTVNSQPTFGSCLAASTVSRFAAAFLQPTLSDADWTVTDCFAAVAQKPLGTFGTITNWGGLLVDDPTVANSLIAGTGAGTISNPYSVKSVGTTVVMAHAGAARFGAIGNPTAGTAVDVQGRIDITGDLRHQGTNVGFYNTAPVAKPAAYTQTYSTADRTLAAYTANVQGTAYTGAADGEAKLADLNALRVAYENLRAFCEDAVQMLNAVVDDHQALGLA